MPDIAVIDAPWREQKSASKASGPYRFVCIEHPAAFTGHVAAWEALAREAIEPNVFHEPWLMRPALAAYGPGARFCFVLAYHDRPGEQPLLCGFFPFERARTFKGLPLPHLRLWHHKHSFLGTPLLRPEHARECLERLFDWLASDPRGARFVDWPFIAADGPFYQVLRLVLAARAIPAYVHRLFGRAMLERPASAEEYVGRAISHKARKDLRRRLRRLRELGPLDYVELDDPARVEEWIEQFLRLEAAGWKGREGTALAQSPECESFFRGAVAEAARRGQLVFSALRHRGRAIAMQCVFLSGAGAYAFKIAYDEAYARYSPGLALELEHLARFAAEERSAWMDSCASATHFMADRIWLERREIASVLCATRPGQGGLLLSTLPLLRRGYGLLSPR